jgi:hypothetical protein
MPNRTDATTIATYFARKQYVHDHGHVHIDMSGTLHHYGKAIARWNAKQAFGRTIFVPIVTYDGGPTEARMLIIRAIVRVLGIHDMQFGMITTHKRIGGRPVGMRTPTLNGEEISFSERIALCGDFAAIALAIEFGHQPYPGYADQVAMDALRREKASI